jgi:hypothetical protein
LVLDAPVAELTKFRDVNPWLNLGAVRKPGDDAFRVRRQHVFDLPELIAQTDHSSEILGRDRLIALAAHDN